MLFADFARSLQSLEQTSSRLEMTRLLAELFQKSQVEETAALVYLLQGSVVPQYQKLDFSLGERLVFKAMLSSFSLNERTARQKLAQLGDLGQTVEDYRSSTVSLFAATGNLSLLAVFAKLKDLAERTGNGSQEYKLAVMADLFQQLDPLSCRYVVRMVVGTLRLGFSDMTVLDALSWQLTGDKTLRARLERAFNVRPDLGLIAQLVRQNDLEAIDQLEPQPGVPILMARAERVKDAAEIIAKIGRCSIEPKYDGFRLQVHKLANGTVRIFSRNLDDIGAMFPDLVGAVGQELEAKECIIEGEAVGYNPQTNQILPFQEIVQRKRKYEVEEKAKEIPLKLFAFDLLFNEHSFLDATYEERRSELRKVVNSKSQTILVAKEEYANDAPTVEKLFEKAVAEGLEGIMAKKLTGKYQAGARGWNWIKLKHSYSQKMIDTIDCLVMGYDYGKGKRTDFGIGAFLVGVFDPQTETYLTVAKIGTGLTDDEWRTLKSKAEALITKTQPAQYQLNKLQECDVWLRPLLVVEIRADEISRSPAHSAELALRFPRLEQFRDDKNPRDVTTIGELKAIYAKQHKSAVK